MWVRLQKRLPIRIELRSRGRLIPNGVVRPPAVVFVLETVDGYPSVVVGHAELRQNARHRKGAERPI